LNANYLLNIKDQILKLLLSILQLVSSVIIIDTTLD